MSNQPYHWLPRRVPNTLLVAHSPPQASRPQSAPPTSSHSSGPASTPQSASDALPSAPTPASQAQSIHPFSGGPYVLPRPPYVGTYTPAVGPQTNIKPGAWHDDFVAKNLFQISHGKDGAPLWQAPTPESALPNPEKVVVTSSCGAHASPSRLYGHESTKVVLRYLSVTLPTQIYLLFLLQLPALYSSRVDCIFEEVDMMLPKIESMVLKLASQGLNRFEIEMAVESSSVHKRLTSTWESFIDSVMREWKIFNIISVLLSSTILAILQIESAAEDPLTRFTVLFSLICALISLLFGCMYMVRFGSMRKTHKATEWAQAAKRTKTLIWWNVWVMLAMPVIWLTWSIMLYIVCIMSFVWRSGVTSTAPPGISDMDLLAIRITITVVLGIGMVYGILIMTTFRQYGVIMDKAWKQRIDRWIEKEITQATSTRTSSYSRHYTSDSTILPTFYR